MSSFLVYRKKEYAVVLADTLASRRSTGTNKSPLTAPKLTHVAPCVFAAHAGFWEPAYEILSNLHEYLLLSPSPRTFDEVIQYLEQESSRCFQKWCEAWKKDSLDLRIPIIFTGPYRHPEDIANELSSTCVIVETARKLKPARVLGAFWVYDTDVTQVACALLRLPAIDHLLNSGPLSSAQALSAVHSFVAEICVFVSVDCSIVIIGDEDEHTLVKGTNGILAYEGAEVWLIVRNSYHAKAMVMYRALKTPTSTASSSPTPDRLDANLSLIGGDDQTPSKQESPPSVPSLESPGLEINLGPVTITGIDLSDPDHLHLLASILGVLAAALVYREYVRTHQHHIDKAAFDRIETTIARTIDQIQGRQVSLEIGILDYVLHPRKVREHNQLVQSFRELKKQLHAFERESGGRINSELEKAVHHLSETTATETPNIDALVAALDGVYNVSRRLNLSETSIHTIASLAFQLRKARRV